MSGLFSGNLAVQEQLRQLFRCLLAIQPATRPALLGRLDLPPTSLNRSLDRLLAAGLIETVGQAESTGGRPASLFCIRRAARRMLGIAIAPPPDDSIRLMLLDLSLEPIASATLTRSSRQPTPVLDAGQPEPGLDAGQPGPVVDAGQPGPVVDAGQPGPGSDAGLSLSERIISAAESLAGDPDAGGRLLGIGLDGAAQLADEDRLAFLSMLAERFACPVFCDDGLAGAGFLLARTAGTEGGIGLLSLDHPLTLVTAASTAAPATTPSVSAIESFPVIDLLEEHGHPLRPLVSLLTPDAVGRRFASLREQDALGFADFCLACSLEKKKALRLLDATASALAQAAVGMACVASLSTLVVSGAITTAVPSLMPAAAEKTARLSQDCHADVEIRTQPFGDYLRAAGCAALVLSRALAAPAPERLQA